MKKVCLLGDSIRMGYESFVKEYLKEYEVIYQSDDNGRFITYDIWLFNQLNKKYGPFDYVHFNAGYWDMNQEGPKGEPQIPVPLYKSELKRLIGLIKETGAIPVFSTTIPIYDTPVKDGIYEPTNYKNAWVLEYNLAAIEVMEEENVPVNDMYSVALKGKRYYKCSDSLHLTEEGYKVCAASVADIIRRLDKQGEENMEEKNLLDLLLDEENDEDIVLYGENDEEITFEQIATIPLDGNYYFILRPIGLEGYAEDEAFVFTVKNNELVEEEDEKIGEAVFEAYYELLDNEEEA